MPKITTTAEMRTIEQAADASGHSYAAMMDMAGAAVAERVLAALKSGHTARIVVLVGVGNNGGDGLVAAAYLKRAAPDAEVSAYLLKARDAQDEPLKQAREAGVFIVEMEHDAQSKVLKNLLAGVDVLVDALLGTGTQLPLRDNVAKLLTSVKGILAKRAEAFPKHRASSVVHHSVHGMPLDSYFADSQSAAPKPYIIAVDCPSGLDCDTGALDEHALAADETVTFGAAKFGQVSFPGAAAVGQLYMADIGVGKLKELKAIKTELADGELVKSLLPPRPPSAHKGTFGKVFMVTGSVNYIGAAYLAASAAYRVGAGLVTVGVPQMILPTLAGLIPEATWVLMPNDMGVVNKGAAKVTREECAGYDALLVGCGIGDDDPTREFMQNLLQPEEAAPKATPRKIGLLKLSEEGQPEGDKSTAHLPPLVIDADGLNVLAKMDHWHKLLPPNTILTPHPGEFARLAKLENAAQVQAQRVTLAREKAHAWKAIVVLKGAFTVIAAPDGRVTISPFASAKLATAGTGDVLAGAIAGLLGQGLPPYEAAVAGVWLHGCAGLAASAEAGGTLASHVAAQLSVVVERLRS